MIVGLEVGSPVAVDVFVSVEVVDTVSVTAGVQVGGRNFENVGVTIREGGVLDEQPTINESKSVPATKNFAVKVWCFRNMCFLALLIC